MIRKCAAALIFVTLLTSCSTLNFEPKSVAEQIGKQQRREQCLKEFKNPCPQDDFPILYPHE